MITCDDCVFAVLGFSDIEDEGLIAKCHRYPPTPVMIGDDLMAVRPDADGGCGEHRTETVMSPRVGQ